MTDKEVLLEMFKRQGIRHNVEKSGTICIEDENAYVNIYFYPNGKLEYIVPIAFRE